MGRIGIYGGTFNPPHVGHVEGAKQAIELLKLDKLLLIPDREPPHKELPQDAPTPQQRLELVSLAAQQIPGAEVCDVELHRQGVSYTSDTLEALHEIYRRDKLYLIMGTDMFLSFHHWYQTEKICRHATLAVLLREQRDQKQRALLQDQAQYVRAVLGGKVKFLENDILPMSSTNVRRMLVFQAPDGIIPETVLSRIRELGLYGIHRDLRGLTEADLEKAVTALLDPKRVPHVLGCRDTAVYLAKKYGADPVDAARAGLLHDVTKALPPELQRKICTDYNAPIHRYVNENPKTLHAVTGALVAERIFGENEAVCRAVDSHTTGCANMDTLQKIIYIADYMEPNRDFPGVEHLRELAEKDLDRAVLTGIEMTVEVLRQQGRRVSDNSQAAIEWLKNKVCNSAMR